MLISKICWKYVLYFIFRIVIHIDTSKKSVRQITPPFLLIYIYQSLCTNISSFTELDVLGILMHLGFILLSTGQEIAPKLSREISKKLTKAFFSNSIGSTSKVMFMLCIRFCICIYRVPQQGNIYYLYNTSKVIFVSCIRFCIYIYDIYIYIYI